MNNSQLCNDLNKENAGFAGNANIADMARMYMIDMSNMTRQCYGCGSNDHKLSDCIKHNSQRDLRKENAGKWAENYISKHVMCQKCSNSVSLKPAELFLPSLDCFCSNGCLYEIKSKCLSVDKMPEYIKINAGEYRTLKRRILHEGLSIIVLFYAVDEELDIRNIRQVRYIDNENLRKGIASGYKKTIVGGLSGNRKVVITDGTKKTEIGKPFDTIHILKNKSKSVIVIPQLSRFTQKIKTSV